MKQRPIVAFGDSMTKGHTAPAHTVWPALLADELKRRLGPDAPEVINAGANGNTTAEGLARIDRDVLAHRPALVLVEFGNDSTDQPARHVPIPQFRTNLHTIHRLVTGVGAKLALMTFPPIVNDWHHARNNPYYARTNGCDGAQEEYRQATREEAQTLGCLLFDLDRHIRAAAEKQGWAALIQQSDGVHFTDEGNRVAAEGITPFVMRQM